MKRIDSKKIKFCNLATNSRPTGNALTGIVAEAAKTIQATSNQIIQSTITLEILELLHLKKDKYFSLVSVLFSTESTIKSFDIQAAFGKRLEEINCFSKTVNIMRYFLEVVSLLPKTSGTFALLRFAYSYLNFAILCCY